MHYSSIDMQGYRLVGDDNKISFGVTKTAKGWRVENVVVETSVSIVPRFVVPAGSPVRAAETIKEHYSDSRELEILIDNLLVTS